MNLHEYQSKQLFIELGLPVPKGHICDTPQEAFDVADRIDTEKKIIKCQVHAGGRGKAGGIKLYDNGNDIKKFAQKWLGKRLVTCQTNANGQLVSKILVEEVPSIVKEFYLGAVVDRVACCIVFMASTEGGVEIENVAKETPDLIHKVSLNSLVPQAYQGRELAFKLGLEGKQINQFVEIFMILADMFVRYDLALLEINPLAITDQGNFLCLDAKISLDPNAMYRQKKLHQMYDLSQEDEREVQAARWGLNYVALEGDIGCMVNGAGLAMGTMDVVHLHGGQPANFLDVGGGATQNRVVEAFKIILSDTNVKAVLVNIFGGIVQCDLIADGIIGAVEEVGIEIPLVVRLEGNSASLGSKKLADSSFRIIIAASLTEAAKKVVEVVRARRDNVYTDR
ncbi:succinyl-CoA ligase subunit beta [Candidatus Photodesmus blepharus]|uniref:Succinate--CoA ligase [ADP-forming] subunit beta n=1 Tax=Candidatus Photodesmus blepharonis TaxID=1179155 RepID=A0A084CN09_9GAMM|nr:ADP-forming succinate--CoA ligase subunit beta [Candidatus Photodesmus blepharus]KEY91188.1 succinyl-CoA ligase subunit beta [Candidatus Photodesmus blepharus]